MGSNLLTNIENHSKNFSKGQRLIEKYILEHYDKAAFMTAAKLGTAVGVSESTVVRFAMEIGYDGYPQLQKAMQEMIRSRLTSVQRIEVTNQRIGDGDILESVLNLDIEKIRTTLEETSKEDFYAAVNDLCQAECIYILGARSASSLASFLGYYFSMLFKNVKVVNPSSETDVFEQMLRISEKDAVIGISFPRYSRKAVKAMNFASARGAKFIAITDSESSPLTKSATRVLIARSDMASIVDSLVAPMSLINALIVAVALKKKDEISKTLSQLETVWDEYNVYEKVEEKSEE